MGSVMWLKLKEVEEVAVTLGLGYNYLGLTTYKIKVR